MAVTFVAIGTSIPDAYTSIVVVKEGMVDMGVSNIIGSNVFDLLIGLAFPWFVKSIFNNGYVHINSNGLGYDAVLLFACVLATLCIIHIRKWHLDRRSGYVFLSVYVAFVIFSAAIELNVFSMVNLPMCK
jgi:sodium/potassium/calcium exchanger 3/sodium/potassium/calcium exchanger 4